VIIYTVALLPRSKRYMLYSQGKRVSE